MSEVGLREFQREFVAALIADGNADVTAPPSSPAHQPGFAVYRNTVRIACIDALRANYPTVRQIVGDAWFTDAATIFVAGHWPHSSLLARYGEDFADFLAGFEPARELVYLPGVAQLDRCWSDAHLAADAPLLDAVALASRSPAELAVSRLVPHPAARWMSFASMPVFTLWRRHREGLAPGDDLPWHGEGALLARPRDVVVWCAISATAAAFLDASARGASFVHAIDAADAAQPGAEIGDWLPPLIAAGAFQGLERIAR